MNSKKVSVVIPSYKGSDNVCRSVESVLNQTYENIEIIVVDDNGRGTEEQLKTEAVLKKYIDEGKVKYLTHEVNKNGAAARNTGVAQAEGEFIAFLDDDDEFRPHNIENHIKRFETLGDDYAITYCAKCLMHKDGRKEIITPKYEGSILYEFMCSKIRMGSSFLMIRKSAFEKVNGFDETFRRHQDWEFIARVLVHFKAAKITEVGLNKFLIFRNSAKTPEQFEKNRLYYLERLKFIIDSFDEEKRTTIYDTHYCSIGKEYFKAKKFKQSLVWAKKTSKPLKYTFKYFKDGLRFIKRKMEK